MSTSGQTAPTGQTGRPGAGNAISAERLRQSPQRRRELESMVEGYAPYDVDVDVVLTPEVPTACVTSWDAIDNSDDVEDHLFGESLDALRGRCSGDYLMFIRSTPADLSNLPTSNQRVADRMMQFGLALHELGHVLFTDFEGTSELIEDRLDESVQPWFDQYVHNPGEDVRVEYLLREQLGDAAARRQRATHQLMRSPLDDFAPLEGFTFMQAVKSAFMDDGLYDLGVTEAALDETDDRVQWRDPEEFETFQEVYPKLQDVLVGLKDDDSREAVHRLLDFWEDYVEPAIDIPDDQDPPGAQSGTGGPGGRDGPSAGNGPLPTHEDGDDVLILVVDADAVSEDVSESAVSPEDVAPDVEDGQATLDDFQVVAVVNDADEDTGSDEQDLDDEASAECVPGLDGEPVAGEDVEKEEAKIDAEATPLVPREADLAAEEAELEQTAEELTPGDGADSLSILPEVDSHSPASVMRWDALCDEAAGFVDTLAYVFDDNDTSGLDAPYANGHEFDPRSAWRVPVGDPNLLGVPAVPDDKEYDILLVLDRSGSMRGIIESAEDTVVKFAVACRSLGLNVSIMDFLHDEPRLVAPFDVELDAVSPLLVSKDRGGSTPLGDVMEIAQARMQFRPASNRGLILVVTDGRPDDDQVAKYREQLESARDPIAGLTLVPGQQPGEVPDEVTDNEQLFDAHEYVWSLDALGDQLDNLAASFSGFF